MTLTQIFNRDYGGDWWWDGMRCWICQDTGRVIRRVKNEVTKENVYWMHQGSLIPEKLTVKPHHKTYSKPRFFDGCP